MRGLSTEGNLHFEIDWASLIVGSKFTIFALFYFVFEGKGLYLEGRFIRGFFLHYKFGELILFFGGACNIEGLIF